MDRLRHEAPTSRLLLEEAARRGHNLGSAVAGLGRLLDTWGAAAVEAAIVIAMNADTQLPDDDRVRNLHVTPHALDGYDQEVPS